MTDTRTNEWEFQGAVLGWLNAELEARPGMDFECATQEPSKITKHRSDLVVWRNRLAEGAFLTIELKTPKTAINQPELLSDACTKAQRWGAPVFAIWNMRSAELYRTPPAGKDATPDDRIGEWGAEPLVKKAEDWLRQEPQRAQQPKQCLSCLSAQPRLPCKNPQPDIAHEQHLYQS